MRIIGLAAAVSSMSFAAACGSIITPPETAGKSAGHAAVEVFKAGERAVAGNLAMTVKEAHISDGRDTELSVPPPEDGNIYLLVDVSLENLGPETEFVASRMQVVLYDSTGRTQQWALFPASKGSIDGGLEPGQSRDGQLAWEISEDARDLKLVFGHVTFAIGDASDYWQRTPGGKFTSRK
jgi:hypothetical protein